MVLEKLSLRVLFNLIGDSVRKPSAVLSITQQLLLPDATDGVRDMFLTVFLDKTWNHHLFWCLSILHLLWWQVREVSGSVKQSINNQTISEIITSVTEDPPMRTIPTSAEN
ncbi:hypothetical protein XENORESO_019636 [Xenotaenia resolanae]|uniref:Uncharacterized protein n=1 Tax=Xenotaenia resolanae TaxID=208358 RepID=A0ABV0VMI8_9TELE